jgi:3D (Asp-Asp-Asp) domain-containing protein
MRNCSHIVSIALVLTTGTASVFGAGKRQQKIQVETHAEKIQSGILYEFNRSLGPGRLVRAHDGVDGSIKRTYRVTYVDEKPVKTELLKEVRNEAQPTVFYMGRGGVKLDRGSFGRKRVLDMLATAYDPGPASNGWSNRGRTRTGRKATFGEVAVDPRVIPLGSVVFVEGYGLAIASDTGSAIKGKRIDLCYDSKRVADGFGWKKVRVHVLSVR